MGNKKTLTAKLPKAWEDAKKFFNKPGLSFPVLVEDLRGGACFNFKNGRTTVSKEFIRELAERGGITVEDALLGVLTHEIGHYMRFPRTLGTAILLGKMIDDWREFKDQPLEIRNFIFQTFADMVNDTNSMLEGGKSEAILQIRRAGQKRAVDKLNHSVRAVMLACLELAAGNEPELDKELKEYLYGTPRMANGKPVIGEDGQPQHSGGMKAIDFLLEDRVDKEDESKGRTQPFDYVMSMRIALTNFGSIIIDMIKKFGGMPELEHEDCEVRKMLKQANGQEVREALRQIALRVTRGEFREVVEWVKSILGEDGTAGIGSRGGVRFIGTSEGELKVSQDVVDYYIELSRGLGIVTSKRPAPTKTMVRSFTGVQKWRAGGDPALVLPASSGGVLLPGITKQIRIGGRPINSTDYNVPDALVIIDSSASMPNPAEAKSMAVLGGFCVARSYHMHGGWLGVINFSGSSFYLPYTRELGDALGAIAAYQGGGTVADLEMIERMMGKQMRELYEKQGDRILRETRFNFPMKKEVTVGLPEDEYLFRQRPLDVVMITDGGIMNIDRIVKLFEDRAEVNRCTIILADHGGCRTPEIENSEKIRVFRPETEEDIPRIAIRETRSAFGMFANFVEGLQ